MLRQETVWNSFRANSPHACPEACPTYFLNATRSSHRNEVSSLLADLTRGKHVSVFIWLSIEVKTQYFNDEVKANVSCFGEYNRGK